MEIATVLAILMTLCRVCSTAEENNGCLNYRLPRNVWPKNYTLHIKTNVGEEKPDCYKFQGYVHIELLCEEETSSITLHAKDLNIIQNKTTLVPKPEDCPIKCRSLNDGLQASNDKEIIGIKSQTFNEATDFFIIELCTPLTANSTYVLSITFEGVLGEGMAGLYRSSYVDRTTGKTRWLAVTQFEATDARRAFPCFDEPEFKARFRLSIERVKCYNSISNMPLLRSESILCGGKESGWMIDYYDETPQMSTYLLAFVVSDFEHCESEEQPDGVTFRLWARRDALPQADFAGKVGPSILRYFQTYFDVKYPLPKLDMVAIPDFSAGAMENWGLITFREALLLYDPNVSSISAKVSVASVISHELAHQWFGNLVTMRWWTDLWLNEGFATYVASLGLQYVNPKWNAMDAEASDSLQIVFASDALESSHPVSVKIGHPSMIGQIFDGIAYKKGGLLLRMMNMFLGEDVFCEAVTTYLENHKYCNAEQDDLWYELTLKAHCRNTLAHNMTVKQVMDTWTLQTGYPLVTVTRNYASGESEISQQRYLAYQKDDPRRKSNPGCNEPCWLIPISYTHQMKPDFDDTTPKLWLSCEQPSACIMEKVESDAWLILNVKFAGPFRVNYDPKNWKLIQSTLDSERFECIGELNRVQILEDVMALAWTGDLDYSITLKVLNYLPRETKYLPWRTVFFNMNTLDRVLRRTLGYGMFRKYLHKLLATTYDRLGDLTKETDPDEYEETKHRILVSAWACRLDLGSCLNQARCLYKKWMDEGAPNSDNPIPRDLRSTVYCTAIKYGGEQEWDFAWQRYLQSNVGAEKGMLLASLGCTREGWLIKRYLEWSINSKSGIRRMDSFSVFASLVRNDVAFGLAKEFLMQNICDIYKYHSPKSSILGRYLEALAEQMYLEEEIQEFKTFVEQSALYLTESQLGVNHAIDILETTVEWHKKYYESFTTLLKNMC